MDFYPDLLLSMNTHISIFEFSSIIYMCSYFSNFITARNGWNGSVNSLLGITKYGNNRKKWQKYKVFWKFVTFDKFKTKILTKQVSFTQLTVFQ